MSEFSDFGISSGSGSVAGHELGWDMDPHHIRLRTRHMTDSLWWCPNRMHGTSIVHNDPHPQCPPSCVRVRSDHTFVP